MLYIICINGGGWKCQTVSMNSVILAVSLRSRVSSTQCWQPVHTTWKSVSLRYESTPSTANSALTQRLQCLVSEVQASAILAVLFEAPLCLAALPHCAKFSLWSCDFLHIQSWITVVTRSKGNATVRILFAILSSLAPIGSSNQQDPLEEMFKFGESTTACTDSIWR